MQRAKRLFLLDLLRGLASLSVVLWHYQHFFFVAPFTLSQDFHRAQQPFYAELSLLYNEGSRAVDLFFVLSGFIFFFQYAESIRTRVTTFREFALLRFSRLYPLHAITLVTVAAGQWLYQRWEGHLFVYGCNDWKRFILSATFTSDWLPSSRICSAFNGPTWSLSVEIFLYLVFFGVARFLFKEWRTQLLWSTAAVIIGLAFFELGGFHLFGSPVFCFFAGGVCCLLWLRCRTVKEHVNLGVASISILTISLIYGYQVGFSTELLGIVIFPCIVLALACVQNAHHDAGRSVRLVGDLTYSTYLLHFPLQLGIVLLVASGAVAAIDFNSRIVWAGFFAVLFVLSMASYYLIELPAQRRIRAKMKILSLAVAKNHVRSAVGFDPRPTPDLNGELKSPTD